MTSKDLMQCAEVSTPMQQLHQEMGGTEQFLQSAVAADLVQIEQHLVAELPVSLRVKESNMTRSEIFRFSRSRFLIVSS